MDKIFASFIVLSGLAIFAVNASGSEENEARSTSPMSFVLNLAGGKVHEDCLMVKSEQTLWFAFSATLPVEFNLHYHDKSSGKTLYAVGPVKVSGQFPEHSYAASRNQLMCLMWKNSATEKNRLEYSHRLEPTGNGLAVPPLD